MRGNCCRTLRICSIRVQNKSSLTSLNWRMLDAYCVLDRFPFGLVFVDRGCGRIGRSFRRLLIASQAPGGFHSRLHPFDIWAQVQLQQLLRRPYQRQKRIIQVNTCLFTTCTTRHLRDPAAFCGTFLRTPNLFVVGCLIFNLKNVHGEHCPPNVVSLPLTL